MRIPVQAGDTIDTLWRRLQSVGILVTTTELERATGVADAKRPLPQCEVAVDATVREGISAEEALRFLDRTEGSMVAFRAELLAQSTRRDQDDFWRGKPNEDKFSKIEIGWLRRASRDVSDVVPFLYNPIGQGLALVERHDGPDSINGGVASRWCTIISNENNVQRLVLEPFYRRFLAQVPAHLIDTKAKGWLSRIDQLFASAHADASAVRYAEILAEVRGRIDDLRRSCLQALDHNAKLDPKAQQDLADEFIGPMSLRDDERAVVNQYVQDRKSVV
jgi:hypothetical protein